MPVVTLPELSAALEASWDRRTAYLGVHKPGNAALGQCYPTSRVVQWFFPELDIVSGEVDTGSALETHFWNIEVTGHPSRHVDLSWQQFPEGSKVTRFSVLDRDQLNDTPPTIARCQLLLDRVLANLEKAGVADRAERHEQQKAILGGRPG